MEMKYMWAILAAVLIVAELLTAGLFLVWFGIAAAVAAVLAFFKFGLAVQWIVFIILSLVLFFSSRRFAEKITDKQPSGVGADRILHKEAIVIEEINILKNTGRIRVNTEEWRAVPHNNNKVIPVDAKVKVLSIDGTKAVVEKI